MEIRNEKLGVKFIIEDERVKSWSMCNVNTGERFVHIETTDGMVYSVFPSTLTVLVCE